MAFKYHEHYSVITCIGFPAVPARFQDSQVDAPKKAKVKAKESTPCYVPVGSCRSLGRPRKYPKADRMSICPFSFICM